MSSRRVPPQRLRRLAEDNGAGAAPRRRTNSRFERRAAATVVGDILRLYRRGFSGRPLKPLLSGDSWPAKRWQDHLACRLVSRPRPSSLSFARASFCGLVHLGGMGEHCPLVSLEWRSGSDVSTAYLKRWGPH